MTTFDPIRAMLVTEFKLDIKQRTLAARLQDHGIDAHGMAEMAFNMGDAFPNAVHAVMGGPFHLFDMFGRLHCKIVFRAGCQVAAHHQRSRNESNKKAHNER